jgi:glycerophosphoryl diester phosphodiesterase
MTPTVFDRPVAHRGYHDRQRGVIENSAAAFEAAIAKGFGIECDLQLTRDGEVIVFHDNDLARLIGKGGTIHETSGNEIRNTALLDSADNQCPQDFQAFLAQIAGRTPLVIELKLQPTDAGNRQLAARAAEMVKGYDGPFVFKSFAPQLLKYLRANGYTGPLGIITYAYNRPDWYGDMPAHERFVLRHLLHYPMSRFTFISCEQTSLGLPAVRLFRLLGLKVMSWTVRDKASVPQVRERADQIVFEGFDPDGE